MENNFEWQYKLYKRIRKKNKRKIFKNEEVIKVKRSKRKVHVHSKSFTKAYDKIIFAAHADDILKLLDNPSKKEKRYFLNINMKENLIFVHQDENFMPRNKNVWSSWNVIINDRTSNL